MRLHFCNPFKFMDYYAFTDRGGMEGWVCLVGWPIVDSLPRKWSPFNHRSGAGQWKSDVLSSEPCRVCVLIVVVGQRSAEHSIGRASNFAVCLWLHRHFNVVTPCHQRRPAACRHQIHWGYAHRHSLCSQLVSLIACCFAVWSRIRSKITATAVSWRAVNSDSCCQRICISIRKMTFLRFVIF